MAQKALEKSQSEMQCLFERKAVSQSFKLGDQVLVLFPMLTSPFQAKFSGPYTVESSFK